MLEKNDENKEFLNVWFLSLVAFAKRPILQRELDLIPQVIQRIFDLNISNFSAACEVFNIVETANIYEGLKIWNSGKLSHIFSATAEIDWSNPTIAFNFSEIIDQKPVLIPIVNYLLYRIEENLNGEPAIIVLSEAWSLVNNAIFAPQMNDFLVRMRRKNCVVIFTADSGEEVGESEIIFDIKKNVHSEIYMPNEDPHYFYSSILGLNDEEIDIVKIMSKSARHFLLKNRGDSIIASLNLNKLSKIKKILASDEIAVAVMEEVMAASKDDSGNEPGPEIWIPQFLEVLEEIELEQIEEQKRLEKEAVIEEKKRKASLE